ncbi:MAG: hypothetical protein J6Z02_07180 [Lachnospiraceae bacterium]|nr:hypothetical protein [Lachnospiraceae bacterium]
MDSLSNEIKQALLGDLVPDEKRLAVSGQRKVIFRNGLRDGFGSVFFFGILKKRRWYYVNKKAVKIEDKALKVMQNMGRMLNLRELSGGDAVYISYIIGRPVVLTYTVNKDKLTLAAYSGRSLFGLISVFRALFTFEAALEGDITRFASDSEKELLKKDKAAKKEAKKEAKLAKKEAKQANKPKKKDKNKEAK